MKASLFYFLIVFGAGFVLGPIRIFLVTPHLGARMAEFLETPIMLVVILFASRWIVRYFGLSSLRSRILTGGIALIFMLIAEFSLVLWFRNLSIRDYFTSRDPVSGSVYYGALVLFAIMPALVGWFHDKEGQNAA